MRERASRPSATATSDREIVLTRVFDAPRELVWDVWTDPRHVDRWWGPTGFITTTRQMDVRPGGVWLHTMRGPDGTDYPNRTVFIEVSRPERLVYTLDSGDDNDPYGFRVTVTFEDRGGKTKLTMQSLFATAEARDHVVREYKAIEGGNQTLDKLGKYLAEMGNPPAAANGRDLVIERVFDAPRELVFKAWTEPEHFAGWWGPRGFTTPFCKIDLRPGGVIRFSMRPPAGQGQDIWCGGVYQEIVEPERIVVTDYFTDEQGNKVPATHYGMDGIPEEMLVTVTFEDLDGKTRMTLRHASLLKDQGESQGWSESFDKLAEYLATMA